MKKYFLITLLFISFNCFSEDVKITYWEDNEMTILIDGEETDYFIVKSELVNFVKTIQINNKELFLNQQILLKSFNGKQIIVLNIYISKDGSKTKYKINNLVI